jgi:hypothetical protein
VGSIFQRVHRAYEALVLRLYRDIQHQRMRQLFINLYQRKSFYYPRQGGPVAASFELFNRRFREPPAPGSSFPRTRPSASLSWLKCCPRLAIAAHADNHQRHTLVHQQVVGPLAPAPAHQPPAHDDAVADLGFAESTLVDHSGTAMEPFPETGMPGAVAIGVGCGCGPSL